MFCVSKTMVGCAYHSRKSRRLRKHKQNIDKLLGFGKWQARYLLDPSIMSIRKSIKSIRKSIRKDRVMARPLSDKTDAMVACRAGMHAWVEVEPDADYKPRVPGEVVWWSCLRECGKEKIEVWSRVTGERVQTTSYRGPQEYSVSHELIEQIGGIVALHNASRLEYMGRRSGKYGQRKPAQHKPAKRNGK